MEGNTGTLYWKDYNFYPSISVFAMRSDSIERMKRANINVFNEAGLNFAAAGFNLEEMEKYIKIIGQAEVRKNNVPYYVETKFRYC
jgi:hypothetical protein